MNILGLSCFYHDAGACLLRDGELIAAAEEERFSRLKHDASLPLRAANYCLEAADLYADDLDYVIFYEKPLLKFERIVAGYAATHPRSRVAFVRAMQAWLSQKLWVRGQIRDALGFDGEILFGEHHVSHAASAFFPSPFDHAAVLTADGVGEWATTTIGLGHDLDLEVSHEIRYPHSLGLLYSAFTAYLGFEVNEGEYKVMGMAAYGRPTCVDKVRKLIDLAEDGSYRLNLGYLAYQHGLRSIDQAFVELFGAPRDTGADLDQRHADIAASIQAVTEDALLGLARRARALSGSENLCMAGGVALNVLANARILRESGFRQVWIQPAAGDAGGCLGAATYLYHTVLRQPRRLRMDTAYLGPSFGNAEIHEFLEREGVSYTVLEDHAIAPTVARLIAGNEVVGWFQGRMEFGPRALGARSILANPTDPSTKDTLNAKIKHREAFRPFAPSTLVEAASTYFDFGAPTGDVESPFMLLTARVKPDKQHLLPAITHLDGTARVQTVSRAQNPLYYALIEEFGKLTGVPVLVNTSFNVNGEPIVCTPSEAFNSFAHTDMDYLVMGNALVPASSKRKLGAYPGRAQVHDGVEVVV
ncbi:MAG: carbamoyltransferase [Chloroflexi bacterium]|nr:carbamoyltransferase [Chloroflexota bacterium]